jgi:hypothetical protein
MPTTEVTATVETTTNYGQFRYLQANRDRNRAHVERLKQAISDNPQIMEVMPILVNENMEIIDGQHRFLAAKELGMPVTYTMVPGLTVDDAREMNILHKNWDVMDYAESYASTGQRAYQQYIDLRDTYRISHSIALMYIYNHAGRTDNTGVFKAFREGTMEIEDLNDTKHKLDLLTELTQEYPSLNTREFAYSYLKALNVEGFEPERFKQKMAEVGEIKRYRLISDYLRAMEDVYNHRVQIETRRLRLY